MIEQLGSIDVQMVIINFGIFVVGMIIGVCIGFSAGRKLAIERITMYVKEKKK